jgi:pre-mRNA-processing factor 6
LGRGASGFTTRGDLGSAIDDGSALAAAQAAAEGRGKRPVDDDDEADQYKDMENETGLFNTLPYEQDDEEADRIYEEVERKMDEKRKQKREAREKEELETFRKERPTIQQQFHDLKRGLSTITSDEWANIPEVQDMVRKRGDGKKVKDEVYGGRKKRLFVASLVHLMHEL